MIWISILIYVFLGLICSFLGIPIRYKFELLHDFISDRFGSKMGHFYEKDFFGKRFYNKYQEKPIL